MPELIRLAYLLVFGGAAVACLAGAWRTRWVGDVDVRWGLLSLLLISGLWAGAYVGFVLATAPWLQLLFYECGLIVGFASIWAWLWFCSAYTGRSMHRSRAVQLIAGTTFVVITFTKLTNFAHGLYFTAYSSTVPFEHLGIRPQILYWITTSFSYVVAAVGFFMLAEFLTTVRGRTRPLYTLFVLTALPALLTGIGYVSPLFLDVPHDSVGVAFFSVGMLFIYSGPFEGLSEAGRRESPAFVIDEEGRIRSYNQPALALVEEPSSSPQAAPTATDPNVTDRPLTDVLPRAEAALTRNRPVNLGSVEPRYFRAVRSRFGAGLGPGGELVVFTDVTAEEERRRRHEARLQGVSDSIPGVVFEFVVQPGGPHECRFVSERAEQVLGLSTDPDSFLDRFARRIPDTHRPDFWASLDEAAASAANWSVEMPFDGPGGTRIWLLGTGHPEQQGDTVLFTGVLLDITERKAAEQALRTAKEQAEEMSRLKTALLSNLNHEFRTPLTSIISFSEIVKEQPGLAERFAERIHNGGQRLLHTLNTVMDFAELEGEDLRLSPGRFDLRSVVSSAVGALQLQADRKDLSLQVDTPSEAVRVRLDHHYTERICVHLLHNAVKFSEEAPVTIGVRERGNAAEVWVRDSGIGIAPNALSHVHKEFFQASRGLNRRHEGNGLGLTIVSRLVQRMGGTINIDSTPDEGTCVTVRFPAA